MSQVWVVGRWPEDESKPWQVQGIFTTKKAALALASKAHRCFVGPVELNDEYIAYEIGTWPRAFSVEENA